MAQALSAQVLLLRGINVGGKNSLPMADLRQLLSDLGLDQVRTYIQSGNAVFCRPPGDQTVWQDRIGAAIQKKFAFRPQILLCSAERFVQAAAANPFAIAEPKSVHFFFLAQKPDNPDLDQLTACKIASESFHLDGRVFYLHTPDGFGRSKLAARVERALGVHVTARNLRTIAKLQDMLSDIITCLRRLRRPAWLKLLCASLNRAYSETLIH